MVDLAQLRETANTLPKGRVAVVSKSWLQEVERDLSELAALRDRETPQP